MVLPEQLDDLKSVTDKSPGAFRTIAEVARDLGLPQHVLRFWETKFPQVRPLKRRGGRRYYRPEDVVLLRAIRRHLYEEGYTIRGVQKLMREGAFKATVERSSEPRSSPPAAVARVRSISIDQQLKVLLEELESARELLRRRQ